MTTYTAIFSTAHVQATEEIDAKTPKQALAVARKLAEHDTSALDWYPFGPSSDVEEIEISGDAGGELALWRSEDLALRLAAPDLLDALDSLIDQIDNLQGESSCIDEDLMQGEAYRAAMSALAKAKGGAS